MATIKHKVYVYAWVSDSGTWNGQFSCSQYKPSGTNQIVVGEHELDVEVPDEGTWDHRQPAIDQLKVHKKEVQANAYVEVQAIEETINKLLALDNNPTPSANDDDITL